MAKPNVRFTITVGTQRCVFLSVIETKTGKLRLIPKTGLNGGLQSDPGAAIIEENCSVHDTDESEEYTQLHYKKICQDPKRNEHNHHLTDTFKKRTGFALLYGSANADLSIPFYAVKSSERSQIINIDQYEPKRFTFCHGIALGPPDLDFKPSFLEPVNIRQERFQRYSVVLMWSFASVPSSPFASSAFVRTFRLERASNEDDKAILRNLMRGSCASECFGGYLRMRQEMIEKQYAAVGRWANLNENQIQRMRILTGHLQKGTTDTQEFQNFLAWSGARLRRFDASLEAKTGYKASTKST